MCLVTFRLGHGLRRLVVIPIEDLYPPGRVIRQMLEGSSCVPPNTNSTLLRVPRCLECRLSGPAGKPPAIALILSTRRVKLRARAALT